ncbi:MAG: DUF4349 domain-containing protein [Bacteroidota bacterium]
MKTKTLMALLAGSTLLAACKGSGSRTDASSADSATIIDSVKLVKTADMRIKVNNVQKVAGQISKLTHDCGGMVVHHDMQSHVTDKRDITLANDSIKKLTVYNTSADLTLKIPTEYVELFMDSLNQMGLFVDERKMDVEDRTLDYLSQKLKVQNREASVKLRSKIKLTQRGADSILQLKDDVVDRKVGNLRTNDAAKFSTLSLTLYQNNAVSTEIVASDDLSNYNNPLSTRLGMAISNGWNFFSQMIIGLVNLWAFIVAGLLIWGGVVWYRRKKAAIRGTGV